MRKEETGQLSLFGKIIEEEDLPETAATPAAVWAQDAAKRALDELFTLTFQYKASKAYHELMQFVAHFRFYSPFNAMLVHIQMPGARFVAPPHRWLRDYGYRIKPGARPLVILQPMGPVMFVFDVSDTEPTKDAKPLPPEIERPYEVRKGYVGSGLKSVIDNAKRDGVRINNSAEGSQSAGSIQRVAKDIRVSQKFQDGLDKNRNQVFIDIPVKYDVLVNTKLSGEAKYATIVHEFAHLYCGHLGTPDKRWWPDRRGLNNDVREFEAESVTFLVCSRLDIDNPSEQYLSGFVGSQEQVPSISFECVMKVAGLIERMSLQKMKPRKQSKNEAGG
jgi:hypothetical protein